MFKQKQMVIIATMLMLLLLIPVTVGMATSGSEVVTIESNTVMYTGNTHELEYKLSNEDKYEIKTITYSPVEGTGGMLDSDGLPYRVGEYILTIEYEEKDKEQQVAHTRVPQTGINRFLSWQVIVIIVLVVIAIAIAIVLLIKDKKVIKGGKVLTVLLVLTILMAVMLGANAVAAEANDNTENVATGKLVITPAPLTLSITLENKVFDGTNNVNVLNKELVGDIFNKII